MPMVASQNNLDKFVESNFPEYSKYKFVLDRKEVLTRRYNFGRTIPKGRKYSGVKEIKIAAKAFNNADDLYLVVGHEGIHIGDMVSGRATSWVYQYGSKGALNIMEANAWQWTMINSYPLTPATVTTSNSQMMFRKFFRKLPKNFKF